MAYVQYNYSSDAAKAQQALNRKNFRGSRLRIKFSRNQKKEKRKEKEKRRRQEHLEAMNDEHLAEEWEEKHQKKKAKNKLKFEANKAARKLRKGRLILRNLPFKVCAVYPNLLSV